MKRRPKAVFLLLLSLAALFSSMYASDGTIVTVVNDQILELSAATMPVRRGSSFYVPYTIFSSHFKLNVSVSSLAQVLTVSSGNTSLYFDIARGAVVDEGGVSYNMPAHYINGSVYLPISLICNKFGFSYSYISHTTPILRISKSPPSISDSSFVQLAGALISNMVYAYQNPQPAIPDPGAPTTPGTPSVPGTPTDPAAPDAGTELKNPSAVYLTFDGDLTENTKAIAASLRQVGRRATFFLTPASLATEPALLRELIGSGHAVGLLVSSGDALRSANEGNDALRQATLKTTRLLRLDPASTPLTGEEKQSLEAAGYRLFGHTFDGNPSASRSASSMAARVQAHFSSTEQIQVLRLPQTPETAAGVTSIVSHLSSSSIPTRLLFDSDTAAAK